MRLGSGRYRWVAPRLKRFMERMNRSRLAMPTVVLLVGFLAGSEEATGGRAAPQSSCLVTTASGDVQGVDLGASCAFLGIPYAASTAGSNRWLPPQAAAPWAPAVLNATTAPAPCAQLNVTGVPTGSEDCLKVNVWVSDPAPEAPAPVIVWLPTGAFVGASNNFASANGRKMAEETGTIVVSPNYRLGAFGFLAHAALGASAGNYGLLDQRAALKWVRDNIAAFGGDPENVTLAGASAGGQSVGLQMVSPGSEGLFHRAIIQGAYPTTRWMTREDGQAQADAFATALGCTDPELVLSCMRSKTLAQVASALPQGAQQVASPAERVFWEPVVDGIEIPDQPRLLFEVKAFHHVPTIIGTNRDEGWGSFITRSFPAGVSLEQYEAWVTNEFGEDAPDVLEVYPAADFPSPQDALARVVGDGQFVCEARRLARSIAGTRTPTFLYSYEYEIDDIALDRVIHGVESNIIFGNNYVPPIFPNHVLDAPDLALHAAMAGYWTRFAAAGNPNSEEEDDGPVVHWPAFKHPRGQGRGSDKYIVFDSVIHKDKRLREKQCDFWEAFFFRSVLGPVPASAP